MEEKARQEVFHKSGNVPIKDSPSQEPRWRGGEVEIERGWIRQSLVLVAQDGKPCGNKYGIVHILAQQVT